ncbi:glycosyltransferase family 4 protein [Robertmurraya sp. DFI.2.37]|uniref:glycosyltransferase family 4 protein n=1 Tax=Robertmurraya sp. DFI.2.37 TaxID=3031819 RepID=UPI001244030C|nr:glycosyltransferase family 4 protein [Robertmurraya sp. DFI.2.37]MDF1507112.1 glycosyltransferase family 4 protein [Robertmurraya sp. DFI.2.37]
MKVLHIPYGSPMIDLCHALQKQGIKATACHFTSNRYQFQPDMCLNLEQLSINDREQKLSTFLEQAIKEYDIFHFHFGESFFPDKRDLEQIKKAGKKMVMHHHGSDVRIFSIARKMNPYIRVKPEWTEKKIRQNLDTLSNYIDHAIVQDYELYAYIQPYYKEIHVIPHTLDVNQIQPAYPEAKQAPLVVHAPTRRDLKGTDHIVKAVNQLKREGYHFHFQLIEGMTYEQTKELLAQADIVIDQLRIGAYGYVSTEAMAFGKPVICYLRRDVMKKYPSGLPIINADPGNIKKVLKDLMTSPHKWKELGVKGRQYVEQNHSQEAVAKQYIHIYQKLL